MNRNHFSNKPRRQTTNIMDIRLEKAETQKQDVTFRLLQYSLYEESQTDQNEMNEDGLFEYPWFASYFTEKERDAFFIKEQKTGRLLGFVMVNTYVQKWELGHSIAEFMVLPKFRRNKIGKKAAYECFEHYPGNWEVSPSWGSRQAYFFWKHVISEYTGGQQRYGDQRGRAKKETDRGGKNCLPSAGKLTAKLEKQIQRAGKAVGKVGESDGPFGDRRFKRYLRQSAAVQVFFHKFPDNAADAETDAGKFNKQVHGGDFQKIVGRDVVKGQVVVKIPSGDVGPVQEHDIAYLEHIRLPSLTKP